MTVLVVYDITSSPSVLSRVSKICEKWGTRIQKSVFECEINTQKLTLMREELESVIDFSKDSIEIYMLGHKNRIDLGRSAGSLPEYYVI